MTTLSLPSQARVDRAAVWLIDRRRFLLARTLWRLSGLI
jgi:hypothetical protein